MGRVQAGSAECRGRSGRTPSSVHLPSRSSALLVVCALLVPLLAVSGGGLTASAASSNSTAAVPQGINPALDPAAQDTGATPSNTPMNVSFVLKARNLPQLEQRVTAGWQGPYLSTAQFAAQYGQTNQV